MSNLQQIQQSVQNAAEAIASVLEVEVTIVDDTLLRIAGTGRYADSIGIKLEQDSVFAKVLRSGRGYVITEPGKHSACETCHKRDLCAELAQVCCPIKSDGNTIGVIALVAFTERQRATLLEQQHDLFGFIDRMADLLSGKAAEQASIMRLEALKLQLETVFNTVREGIVAADRSGRIISMNLSAAKMLNISITKALGAELDSLLPELALSACIASGQEFTNRELKRIATGKQLHLLTSAKPWHEAGQPGGIVVTLQEMSEVRKVVSKLANQSYHYTLDMILGESPALKAAKDAAQKAAASNTTVLIQGESGTGKELFARAIHSGGDRARKPFVAINCAAIPEALLESELFGYEEGAFTGARRGGKPGKFELADGGTLFLDEIGDMTLSLQAKLLRVLQERRIERVGGIDSLQADVRIIAATHKNIDALVRTGEFREDLYYRINVFPLHIPALRSRREDLPLLIQTFLNKYSLALNKRVARIEDAALTVLLAYGWPGNVRELENTIEYLVNITATDVISLSSLPARISAGHERTRGQSPLTTLAELERAAIFSALEKFGASAIGKANAAAALGISKATLYRKLKDYSIDFAK